MCILSLTGLASQKTDKLADSIMLLAVIFVFYFATSQVPGRFGVPLMRCAN